MIARRLLVRGKVQGVFYRAWTEQNARALGLAGWVRNLRTGEVEALIQGPDEAVAEMILRCRRGPPAAVVREILVEETEPVDVDGFGQQRTA